MDKDTLARISEEFSDKSPTNYLNEHSENDETNVKVNNFARNNIYVDISQSSFLGTEGDSEFYGMRFYQTPIFSIGSADDPLFNELKKETVVGPYHKMPHDWIPDAKTVISFFLPFEKRIVEANKRDPREPAIEWLYTRVDGQKHLLAHAAMILDAIRAEGYEAVAPQLEEAYWMRPGELAPAGPDNIPPCRSNWSERHVGYITGLGTFGMSTNFISRAGCAGRLISIVTNWSHPPTEKDYVHYLDYCNNCGACIKRCPAGAITTESKSHVKCGEFMREVNAKYYPRYGCGKCQSGLPCEYHRP